MNDKERKKEKKIRKINLVKIDINRKRRLDRAFSKRGETPKSSV